MKFRWMTPRPLKVIEDAARTCYKSEKKIGRGTDKKLIKTLITLGHMAMLEHASASYRVICSRGVTHEIVRHRLFSYAQESTRYCNYKSGVQFIRPWWMTDVPCKEYNTWKSIQGPESQKSFRYLRSYYSDELTYLESLTLGDTPQEARDILPNALKTEIVITGNFREWLHFFSLRCAKTAHPDMQIVANMIKNDLAERVPVIFNE